MYTKLFLNLLLAVLLNTLPLQAQSFDQTADIQINQPPLALSSSEKNMAADPDQESKAKYFGAYKPNYVLPATWAFNDVEDRQANEIKFQISIKQTIFDFKRYQLHFGYTQKSFWQAYDKENSSPFRETNYNPELFLNSPSFHYDWGILKGFLGFEHESNGETLPFSRSWNRIYTRITYTYQLFGVDYKIWYRIPEEEKEDANDPRGDDNPDIHHYYGYSELTLSLNFEKIQFAVFGRYNAVHQKGAFQIDITSPTPANEIRWYLQYWNGYGESLVDYNRSLIKFGIGLMVKK
jgi:phospholipase A1